MRNLTKASAALGAAGALIFALGVALPTAANADYGPSGTDVVGVGSDTLQNMIDFVADGDALGDPGYNSAGAKNRLVNFDASADANVRLAYGTGGQSGTCAPGTGAGAGSAFNLTNSAAPCILNPTIVLRAGTSPVQRPNGSGAGRNALIADKTQPYKINFARSSSAASAQNISDAVTNFGGLGLDSVNLGTDPLAMMSTTTSHAVPLSTTQIAAIYTCTGGGGAGGQWRWSDVGGSSNNLIIPIVPQNGSGTFQSFMADIGNPTLGSCVKVSEENDPYAPFTTTSPDDAIEPLSGARLNLFDGILGATGLSNGVGGYFKDPSCPYGTAGTACNTPLAPTVKLWTTGTPSAGGSVYVDNRTMRIYFRDSDVNGVTAPMQPGGTNNWIRTLFYNPCSGTGHTTGCTTVGSNTYGPGGAPYVAKSAGQALISAAGFAPIYSVSLGS